MLSSPSVEPEDHDAALLKITTTAMATYPTSLARRQRLPQCRCRYSRTRSDLVQVERAPKERPFELRYQNFSVIMSRSRRFCCITGVNIDGQRPFFSRLKRPGWKTDPRVPEAAQVGGAEFYIPTVFDRGHMVRRLDPVWGAEGAARLANADTHHYTNSCPQVHPFNDATWGDLEDLESFRRSGAGTAKRPSLPVRVFSESPIPCIKG